MPGENGHAHELAIIFGKGGKLLAVEDFHPVRAEEDKAFFP